MSKDWRWRHFDVLVRVANDIPDATLVFGHLVFLATSFATRRVNDLRRVDQLLPSDPLCIKQCWPYHLLDGDCTCSVDHDQPSQCQHLHSLSPRWR